MPARVRLPKGKKRPSPISRLLPKAKPPSTKKSPASPVKKKSPSLSNKIAMKTLIKRFKDMELNSLNNRIRQAEANKKASNSKKNYSHPNILANISILAFNNARTRRNRNGNVIMRKASPVA